MRVTTFWCILVVADLKRRTSEPTSLKTRELAIKDIKKMVKSWCNLYVVEKRGTFCITQSSLRKKIHPS
jgi:hypothetical protein